MCKKMDYLSKHDLNQLNYTDIQKFKTQKAEDDDFSLENIVELQNTINILYDLKNEISKLKKDITIIKEKIENKNVNLMDKCNYRKQKICKNCKYFDDSGYDEVNDYCTKIDWYVDENGICDFYEDKYDENKVTCESCIFFKDNYCSKLNSRTTSDRHCDFYEKK